MKTPFSFLQNVLHSTPQKDKAFSACYDQYYHEIQRLALKMVRDLPTAEDIAGDSFIKLYRDWDKKTGPAHIRNFLFLTTRNAALDYLKQKRPPFVELQEAIFQIDAEREDVAGAMLAAFYHYYDRLSDGERQVIDLLLEGKTYADIAQKLNKSVGAVRKQRHEAVRRLQQLCNPRDLYLLFIIFLLFKYADNQRFGPVLARTCQEIKKIFELGGNKHRGAS